MCHVALAPTPDVCYQTVISWLREIVFWEAIAVATGSDAVLAHAQAGAAPPEPLVRASAALPQAIMVSCSTVSSVVQGSAPYSFYGTLRFGMSQSTREQWCSSCKCINWSAGLLATWSFMPWAGVVPHATDNGLGRSLKRLWGSALTFPVLAVLAGSARTTLWLGCLCHPWLTGCVVQVLWLSKQPGKV